MRVVDTSGTPAPFMDAFPSSPVFARYLPQYTDTTLVRLSYPIVDIPMVLIVLFHYCVKGTFSFVLFWLCTFSLPLACPPSKTRACAISDTSPSHPICMKTLLLHVIWSPFRVRSSSSSSTLHYAPPLFRARHGVLVGSLSSLSPRGVLCALFS